VISIITRKGSSLNEATKMSPRKERYQTPPYIAQAIRDKRKSLLSGIYYCPRCGKDKLQVAVDKEKKEVMIECACGQKSQLSYVPAFELIDYYNKFLDHFKKES
jgi:transcription elongation factor Elf1